LVRTAVAVAAVAVPYLRVQQRQTEPAAQVIKAVMAARVVVLRLLVVTVQVVAV
jgi:hypothetical protein